VNTSEPDNAISDCTKAIRLVPQYADAWYCRGAAYKNKGQTTMAERDFARSKELRDRPEPKLSDPKYGETQPEQ